MHRRLASFGSTHWRVDKGPGHEASAFRDGSAVSNLPRKSACALRTCAMRAIPHRRRVGGSALTTPHFLLLFTAMLVAAAGNTALQSVMPAIGREIGIADLWTAMAYTWSAVLWVLLAPFWARKSDVHGRKPLILMGVGGFIASMALCGADPAVRPQGHARRRPRPSSCSRLPARFTARSAAPSRRRRRPISRRAPAAPRAFRRCRPWLRRSGWGRSSARRWRRCSCCRGLVCRGRCSPLPRSPSRCSRRSCCGFPTTATHGAAAGAARR